MTEHALGITLLMEGNDFFDRLSLIANDQSSVKESSVKVRADLTRIELLEHAMLDRGLGVLPIQFLLDDFLRDGKKTTHHRGVFALDHERCRLNAVAELAREHYATAGKSVDQGRC